MNLDFTDHLTLASLLSVAVIVMKTAEKFFEWASKKVGRGEKNIVIVQLDPESSRMIRETHENTLHVTDLISVRDHDGTPMVYSSRTASENVQLIAAAMQDVSKSQERLASTLDKVEEKQDKAVANTEAILQIVKR